jgi:hypothetical protein
VDDHQQIRRRLLRDDSEAAHLLRKFGERLRDAVLHLDLCIIEVGAERERDGERHHAVARGLREHVERMLDAVDGLLERRRDGFRNRLRIRAWIDRANHDGRWHDLGIFADRKLRQRNRADEEDQDRKHAGKDRALDKEVGDIHGQGSGRNHVERGCSGATETRRGETANSC